MNLTPAEREQVRLCLLRYGQTALSVGLMLSYLRAEGFRRMERAVVEIEVQYLIDKGLMENQTKAVSPEMRAYRTTASGRDYLAEQGQEG